MNKLSMALLAACCFGLALIAFALFIKHAQPAAVWRTTKPVNIAEDTQLRYTQNPETGTCYAVFTSGARRLGVTLVPCTETDWEPDPMSQLGDVTIEDLREGDTIACNPALTECWNEHR